MAELLEDNVQPLLTNLTNPTGDSGEGHVQELDVFSGKRCVRIVSLQRFHPAIPGWKYRITEKPQAGEYRYLRLAWKTTSRSGVMIQFHDTDWNLRYTAGVNTMGWETKFVADKPPSRWTVVTRDLFQDFGERTITGMALTAFDGDAHFDHIYLGRSIDDLDRIDATGYRQGPATMLSDAKLDQLWRNLAQTESDAVAAYQAKWRLVASPKQAVPYLREKLTHAPKETDASNIAQWIRELDDPQFDIREAATKQLSRNLDLAAAALEKTLDGRVSVEMRIRIQRLLALRTTPDSDHQRIATAVRVLEYMDCDDATTVLKDLATNPSSPTASKAAQAALAGIGESP